MTVVESAGNEIRSGKSFILEAAPKSSINTELVVICDWLFICKYCKLI